MATLEVLGNQLTWAIFRCEDAIQADAAIPLIGGACTADVDGWLALRTMVVAWVRRSSSRAIIALRKGQGKVMQVPSSGGDPLRVLDEIERVILEISIEHHKQIQKMDPFAGMSRTEVNKYLAKESSRPRRTSP